MLDSDFVSKVSYIILGAIIGWFLQQYRIARAEDVSLVNEHIKDLEKFRDVSQEYWLSIPDTIEKGKAAAAKVRASHAATTLLYEDIGKICRGSRTAYQRLSIELFTSATGGNFESQREKADAERAIELFDHAARLIHFLRGVRRDLISLKRLWPPFPSYVTIILCVVVVIGGSCLAVAWHIMSSGTGIYAHDAMPHIGGMRSQGKNPRGWPRAEVIPL